MSDLFNKFVFDLQRFDTIQFSQIGATGGYSWANGKPLLQFTTGSPSAATLNVTITPPATAGGVSTISNLTAVTLDSARTGYKIQKAGDADAPVQIFYNKTGIGSLSNGQYEYTFENGSDNSFYFTFDGTDANNFDFSAVGAGLLYDDGAEAIANSSGSGLTYNGSQSLGAVVSNATSNNNLWLRRTGDNEFVLSGLSYDSANAGGDILALNNGAQIMAMSGAGGVSVGFNASTGDFTGATVDADNAIQVSGMSGASDELVINGASVAVNTNSYVFTRAGDVSAIDVRTYDNNGNPTTVTETPNGEFVSITKTGNAEEVRLGALSGKVQIGDTPFTVTDSDGFFFKVANSQATGVSGLSKATDSITGAFFAAGNSFTFNGDAVGFSAADGENTQYTFSLGKLSGLVSGDSITSAGSISTFITNEIIGRATFGVPSAAMSFVGNDTDGVEFNFNVGSFAGISGLNKDLSVTGDFTTGNILVNGASLATNDTDLTLFGTGADNPSASGIGMIDGFTGGSTAAAEITEAGGASMIITDKAGLFSIGRGQSFATEVDDVIEFWMKSGASTIVEGISGFGGTDITADAVLTGALSSVWINEKDNKIIVDGDKYNDFTFMYRGATDKKYVLGGVSGDNVTINGTAGAEIVQVIGSGSYTFNLSSGSSVTFNLVLGGDSNGVEFLFDKNGNLLGISSFDKGDIITGDFSTSVSFAGMANGAESSAVVQVLGDSSITVEHDAFLLRDLSDGANITKAKDIYEAWTDTLAANGSLSVKDASGDVFTFTADAAGGQSVMLLLNGSAEIVGVSSLGAGVTLEGGLSVLTSINTQTFDIKGDSSFGVVGVEGASSIGVIFNLGGDSVTITNAGGASLVTTDKEGTFTFGESAFIIGGDSEVNFFLKEGTVNVTGISSLNGPSGYVEAAGELFQSSVTVNGQSVAIVGDSGNLILFGNEEATGLTAISGVGAEGGTVTINYAGGASTVITDASGTFVFGEGGQSFVTGGADSSVEFTLSELNVTGISAIDADEWVQGDFSGVATVNGQSFAIENDPDNSLTVFGQEGASGIAGIANVGGSATINYVAGASYVATNDEGEFFFGGGQSFVVSGDSSVTFQISSEVGALAAVSGVTNFGDEFVAGATSAVLTGRLAGLNINNSGLSIAVTNDADEIFEYIITQDGQTILGGVSGDGNTLVKITGTGGASIVRITNSGTYQFGEGGPSYVLTIDANDPDGYVDFYVNSGLSAVTKINSFDKGDIITGDFRSASVAFEGVADGSPSSAVVQVLGDSSITVEHDAFLLKNISDGATIANAEGVYQAWTDKFTEGALSIAIQDADSHNFTLEAAAAGQSVMFALDGAGHINGVSALGDNVTLTGSQSALELFTEGFNGMSVVVSGDPDGFGVVGSASGEAGAGITSIINLTGGASVAMAGGASYAFTANDGKFTFTNGEFTIGGDTAVQFVFDPNKNETAADVKGISAFVGEITLDSTLVAAAFEINGSSLDIRDDDDVMTITTTNESSIAGISQIGASAAGTVGIFNAGGASLITTDQVGGFSFATSGQLFKVYGDSSVTFGLSSDKVTTIDDFADGGVSSAVVLGPLNGIAINGDSAIDVAVNSSTSGVNLGYGIYEGAYYLGTYGTSGASSVVVTKAGEAAYFFTSNTGEFTFAGNSTAKFTVAGDSSVVFSIDENVKATGVSYLGVGSESGALQYVGGAVSAMITGELKGFAINGSDSAINVNGDADDIFSYAVDDQGIGSGMNATLGGVSGTGTVEINGTGGASVVEVTGGASYKFFNDKTFTYESASGTFSGEDGVAQFVLNGTSVAAINSFDKNDTVSGDFSSLVEFNQGASAGLDQATVQVSGDSFISVIYDDIIIRNLSDSATFEMVRGISEAWTDALNASASSIEVTDEVGHKFKVSGTSDADGVKFLVNENTGEIYGVESLDEGVTLEGALNALSSINGEKFNIKGDSSFGVVGSAGASGIGVIFDLGGESVIINDAGGASQIYTNDEGVFYFKQDGESATYGITLGSDSYLGAMPNDKAVFELDKDKDSYALGVSGLNYEDNYAGADHEVFEGGFKVNGESVVITGDKDDLVAYALSGAKGIQLITNVGGSDVNIIDIGSASFLVTDKESTLTFADVNGEQVFKTGGDSYVGFMTEGLSVVEVMGLGASGWVEADNEILNNIAVNNATISIENDDNEMRIYGKGDLSYDAEWDDFDGDWDEWGNGITKITKVGNESGTPVIVNSAGSATTIQTDQNGDFYFAGGQSFYVKDTVDAVTDFLMDGSESGAVIGIEGLSEGMVKFNTVTTALSVNTLEYAAQNMSFTWGAGQDSLTLTIDPYEVTEVSTLAAGGAVSGVVGHDTDATVWAEGPVSVNGESIAITDSDNYYGIIVRSGSSSTLGTAQEAVNVTGDDATVNVADFTVTADGNGDFWIGGESYEFTDDDDPTEFKFTTDENQKLESVDSLNGTMVDHDGAVDLLDGFNGDPIVISGNSSPATLTGDNEHLTRIDTLDSGASITGGVSNADIIMVGDSEVGDSIPVTLTVNGNIYELYDDSNGITIRNAGADGIGTIIGLDEETSLKVSTGGVYTVNDKPTVFSSATSREVKSGDVIIGTEDTQSAYLYDANNPLIREKTPLDVIEGITGIPSSGYDSIGGNSTTTAHPKLGIPLNIAESDIIQGFMSASAASAAYPYVSSRYNSSLEVDLNQPLEIWIDNKESQVDTKQDLDLSKTRYAKKVHMYGGTQSVEFNDAGGNLAHIESVASGHKTVDLGDGGDVVVMDEPSAVGNSVSIVGGLKNDSIFVRDSANTTVDVSAGGADKIITYANAGARVTVVGYEPSMEGGIRIDELQSTNMLAAIMGQSSGLNINFGDGVVSIEHTSYDKHSEISLGADANNATFVNLFDYKNNAYPVGFTGIDGGTLDVGITENDPLILVGNYKGNKTAGSVILGGAGSDIVLAGAMDSVDARGGNNTVYLENNAERDGAVVAFTQGRTVVYGMNNTLAASTGDTIVLSANNIKNFKFDGEDVTIDGNGFYGILENVDAEESAEGKYVTQYIYNSDNSTVYKAAGAEAGAIIYLPTDEDVRPNAFFGMNSGINFGNYADPQTVMIDLKGDMAESSIGGSPIYTKGITGLYGYYQDSLGSYVATTENLIFKGSDANDSLFAGNGNTSLYGDGGKNLLVGSYDYDETLSEKEGRVTFFVIGNANGAANTISNFEYVSDNNYKDTSRVTADQIEILEEQSEVVYADVSNNDVYIEVASFGGENKESVVLKDAIDTVTGYGKDFIVSGNVAQVGKEKVLVDRFGEFYMATEKNATINVKEEGSPVTVWLDNPETGKTFRGDFAVIDASTLTSNAQLAGRGNKENTIIGGSGNNSLWGGEGSSNDVLIGGAGKDTFFYGLGNGQDTVEANDGDEVVLGISIDDIVESQSSIGDTSLTLKLRDGGSLTVNDGGGIVDYKLTNSEGVQETYYLDSNRQFKQR